MIGPDLDGDMMGIVVKITPGQHMFVITCGLDKEC